MTFLVDYHTLRDRRTSVYTRYTIREEIQRRLSEFSELKKVYAIYRFGLNGEAVHSREDTSEHFKLSIQEVRLLEAAVLAHIGMRPVSASCHCCRVRKLKDYLD